MTGTDNARIAGDAEQIEDRIYTRRQITVEAVDCQQHVVTISARRDV